MITQMNELGLDGLIRSHSPGPVIYKFVLSLLSGYHLFTGLLSRLASRKMAPTR